MRLKPIKISSIAAYGRHSTEGAFAAAGSFLGVPKKFSDKFFLDVAEINRRHFFELGKLEYVD